MARRRVPAPIGPPPAVSGEGRRLSRHERPALERPRWTPEPITISTPDCPAADAAAMFLAGIDVIRTSCGSCEPRRTELGSQVDAGERVVESACSDFSRRASSASSSATRFSACSSRRTACSSRVRHASVPSGRSAMRKRLASPSGTKKAPRNSDHAAPLPACTRSKPPSGARRHSCNSQGPP